MRFKVSDNIFEETFIIMTQTSFQIFRLAFFRKHAAIIDTAQGIIDFPEIQITMALTHEMQNCYPKPITIKTESKHTIATQSELIIHASILVSNNHPRTGTIQPLPQFDGCAKLIVVPVITTARDKRGVIISANTTDFSNTINPNTKLVELQILKPEETKLILPVDIAGTC